VRGRKVSYNALIMKAWGTLIPLLGGFCQLFALQVAGAASSLTVYPPMVSLAVGEGSHQLLVSTSDADGLENDVTSQAVYISDRPHVARVSAAGVIHGVEPGTATIAVRFATSTQTISVIVEPAPQRRVTFLQDVIPIINRAGCNAGACHAKPKGQNGFHLSIFSYDLESDYEEIVKESYGRRVFPAAPEESLILKKATTTVAHQGGLRFGPDSELYNRISKWIGTGMVYVNPDDPQLEQIDLYPQQRRYRRGARQPLLVQARFSDGSLRDVTHLSVFESRDKDLVKVDAQGRMEVTDRFGEAAVTARFLEMVAAATVTVPTESDLPNSAYDQLPVYNEIDNHVYAQLQRLGFLPADLCTDGEFLRRVYLDAVGMLPPSHVAKVFLADDDPDKRSKLIDHLLDHPHWADHWATKWSDLIRPNDILVGAKMVHALDQWTREQFRRNVPYDQLVRQVVSAQGNAVQNGASVVFRDRPRPEDVATLVAQVFLGVRIECAKCHHHPLDKWSQHDFYQFAAFFGQVGQQGNRGSKGFTIYHSGEGEIKHPMTQEVMHPTPLEGPPAVFDTGADPRVALADWMANPENTFVARAAVNRVWGEFMGRGIVHPVDDFRVSNPPSNGPLLDALARDFVKHGYDLKHVMRKIMRSRVYQLSSFATEYNTLDTKNFSRYYRKRLPAEVLQDAVSDLTGTPNYLVGMAPSTRAIEIWNNKIPSRFMDAFGRPVPLDDPPCDRVQESTLVQSLHLMNSEQLLARITDKEGRAAHLVAEIALSMPEIIDELYLAAYSRYPTESELVDIQQVLSNGSGASRRSAVEDIMSVMINTAEFVFNH